ncbi:hypothetical protein CQ010_01600 [Arthrobacter sp. MYb211]|nr:hypothetical protein CQ010_01600 [Arthrobacter sp. MYb211]
MAVSGAFATVGAFIGYLLTARFQRRQLATESEKNQTEGKLRVAELQNTIIDQLQEERNRMDAKIETMRNEHSQQIMQMRESFDRRLAEAVRNEQLAREYVNILLPHVPPPPPNPPEGYRL